MAVFYVVKSNPQPADSRALSSAPHTDTER
jgi:hypothetical protein